MQCQSSKELQETIKCLNQKISILNERIDKLENKNPSDANINRKKIYLSDITHSDIPKRFFYCGIHVYFYYYKDKREWRGNFKLSNGIHKEVSTKDKMETFKRLIDKIQLYEGTMSPDDFIVELKEPEYEDIDHSNFQIDGNSHLYDYLLYYLYDISSFKETTIHSYLEVLRKIKGSQYQTMPVSAITLDTMRSLYRHMDTSSYQYRFERIIKPAFKALKEMGVISINPTAVFKKSKSFEGKIERVYVHRADFLESISRIEYPYDILLITSYYTGMRDGEIAALKLKDVNFTMNAITVNKEWSDTTKSIVTPKNRASNRIVPLFKDLKKYLKSHIENSTDGNPECFIFSVLMSNRSLRSSEYKYLNEHEISFRTHDLRHTFCTNCYIAGIDGKQTQLWMGHSKYSTTIDVYTRLPQITHDEKLKITEMFTFDNT